jgi:hypothetical protein
MRMIGSFTALLSLLVPGLLPAWNDAGHRTIAFLAYSHLTPTAKARAGEILRKHPDFASVLSPDPKVPPYDASRNAFVIAATWPDLIRNDPRFGASAPPVNSFPDTDRHTAWHFINTPVPPRFSSQPMDTDNAVTALQKLVSGLHSHGTVTAAEAYALPWILHIVGDLHQPLHTVARFSVIAGKAVHDRGGNTCFVKPGRNLHSLWDALLGAATEQGPLARLAASLEDQHPAPRKVDQKPGTWVREGVSASASHVYSFIGTCTEDAPAALSAAYHVRARELARERAALAAYRLAAILNDRLGR